MVIASSLSVIDIVIVIYVILFLLALLFSLALCKMARRNNEEEEILTNPFVVKAIDENIKLFESLEKSLNE